MVRWTPMTLVAAVLFGYLAGAASSGRSAVAAQQAAAAQPPASSAIPLAPNQGEPTYWSGDDLRKIHSQLAARSGGRIVSKPRDLMQLPMMRTHMFDVVHRPQLTRTPSAEQHRSEEHTSELQSRSDLVCRLLLEKKKNECILSPPPTTSNTI